MAVHFRKNKHGDLVGGPIYYIQNGLSKMDALKMAFAIWCTYSIRNRKRHTGKYHYSCDKCSTWLLRGIAKPGGHETINLIIGIVVTILKRYVYCLEV